MPNYEPKEDRFVRVAEKRVNSLLDKIRLLGQTANRRTYAYTDKQVDDIFRVINDELRDARLRFREGNNRAGRKFRL